LARDKFPGQEFKLGDANHLSELFPPEHFDLITFFNVLYHDWISSEVEVLSQAKDLLKPGGWLLATEPAFSFLHRQHDLQAMGHRRYTLAGFSGLLAKAGLEVAAGTYFNGISFLPSLALALAQRLGHPFRRQAIESSAVRELGTGAGRLNEVLIWAMGWERKVIQTMGSIPIGVSLLSLARKAEPHS
jgi:SAM-dependent methyltransferase